MPTLLGKASLYPYLQVIWKMFKPLKMTIFFCFFFTPHTVWMYGKSPHSTGLHPQSGPLPKNRWAKMAKMAQMVETAKMAKMGKTAKMAAAAKTAKTAERAKTA